jgi:hypothetical protein
VQGEHQPYAHSRNRNLAACARLWANLVGSEAFGQILISRADVPLHEVLVVFCTTSSSPDAGVAAHAVVALFRAVKVGAPHPNPAWKQLPPRRECPLFCTTSSSPDAGVAAHAVVALFRAVKVGCTTPQPSLEAASSKKKRVPLACVCALSSDVHPDETTRAVHRVAAEGTQHLRLAPASRAG